MEKKIFLFLNFLVFYFFNFNYLYTMQEGKSDDLGIINKKLCVAVIDKDINDLLNEKGVDVNYNCGKGNTLLHLASASGNYKAVSSLLNYYKYSLFPLFYNYPVNINVKNDDGNTPINLAITGYRIKTINTLLENKNHKIDLNLKNNNHNTSLYLLVGLKLNQKFNLEKKLGLIKEFIKKGANPNTLNSNGNTVLHEAAINGDSEVIETLILNFPSILIDALNDQNETPLYLACKFGNIDALKVLLYYNADPNKVNEFSLTPLDIAIINNHVEIVKTLVSISNINLNLLTTDAINNYLDYNKIFSGGESALFFAYLFNNQEIINILVKAGIDTNIKNNKGLKAEDLLRLNIESLADLSMSLTNLSILNPGK